jgi:exodeoxyribonuclease VII large subunit
MKKYNAPTEKLPFSSDFFRDLKNDNISGDLSGNQRSFVEKEEKIWTVSDLVKKINATLEIDFYRVTIMGEISNLKQHTSGHIYFTLKDEKSQISAVIFRGTAQRLGFQPEDGIMVVCSGDVNVYPEQGRLQINIKGCEPMGSGRLNIEFEKLKKKLATQGIFDEIHKKNLPLIPKRVFLITSPTGAAVRDFIKTARFRFPSANMILIPASVQGERAPFELLQALKKAEKMADPMTDVIVFIRGGGSIEDLWAFNDENLTMAIFSCKIPVVSGVGHEVDFTICDFVSDKRAPTPTGAAQIIFPEMGKIIRQVQDIDATFNRIMHYKIDILRHKIHKLSLSLKDPLIKINEMGMRLDDVTNRLEKAILTKITAKKAAYDKASIKFQKFNILMILDNNRHKLITLDRDLHYKLEKNFDKLNNNIKLLAVRLNASSPLAPLSKGYSMVFKEDGKILVRSYKDVKPGEKIKIIPEEGGIICEVKEITAENK